MFTDISTVLAKEWLELYKKNPKTTSIITVVLLIILIPFIIYLSNKDAKIREEQRLENLSFVKQIDQLNSTEKSLKDLIKFIESHKVQLQESQDLLDSLEKEKDKLEPIVEADRKLVESILEQQARKTQTNVWKERWIGAGFGVIGSLIATVIWTVGSTLWQQRNNNLKSKQIEQLNEENDQQS